MKNKIIELVESTKAFSKVTYYKCEMGGVLIDTDDVFDAYKTENPEELVDFINERYDYRAKAIDAFTNPEPKSAEECDADKIDNASVKIYRNFFTPEDDSEMWEIAFRYGVKFAQSQPSDEEFSPVKQRRLMFDKFYEWMDTMDEHEFDQYSTTALCETFFFDLQQPPK